MGESQIITPKHDSYLYVSTSSLTWAQVRASATGSINSTRLSCASERSTWSDTVTIRRSPLVFDFTEIADFEDYRTIVAVHLQFQATNLWDTGVSAFPIDSYIQQEDGWASESAVSASDFALINGTLEGTIEWTTEAGEENISYDLNSIDVTDYVMANLTETNIGWMLRDELDYNDSPYGPTFGQGASVDCRLKVVTAHKPNKVQMAV